MLCTLCTLCQQPPPSAGAEGRGLRPAAPLRPGMPCVHGGGAQERRDRAARELRSRSSCARVQRAAGVRPQPLPPWVPRFSVPCRAIDALFQPLPEIVHMHRAPERRAPAVVSLLFTLVVVAPLGAFVVLAVRAGANLKVGGPPRPDHRHCSLTRHAC